MNKFSNNQIRQLGNRLKEANHDKHVCSNDDLQLLQDYRLEHKESLKDVFNYVSKVSKEVNKGRIASFRVKKIDTIFSKLRRIETMKLDRMWDIAGCRCIVHSESAIKQILTLLEERYEIKSINDRISNPAEDGYKGIHIYLKPKDVTPSKVVEVQLRTREHHNWATLVEIIDVLYGTKIKEGDYSIPELNEFLKGYSFERKELERSQKLKLYRIEKEFQIYDRLWRTFDANIQRIRTQWFEKNDHLDDNSFIIFSVNTNTKMYEIDIKESFEEAEKIYFNQFKDQNKDILVSHLDSRSFKEISYAYSNYILSSHKFIESWAYFLADLSEQLYKSNKMHESHQVFYRLEKLVSDEIESIGSNLEDVLLNLNPQNASAFKIKNWLNTQINDIADRSERLKEVRRLVKPKKKSKNKSILTRLLKSFRNIIIDQLK